MTNRILLEQALPARQEFAAPGSVYNPIGFERHLRLGGLESDRMRSVVFRERDTQIGDRVAECEVRIFKIEPQHLGLYLIAVELIASDVRELAYVSLTVIFKVAVL